MDRIPFSVLDVIPISYKTYSIYAGPLADG